MFASRGGTGGGKGGKYSVEDLYGISKKPKASSSSGSIVAKSGSRSSKSPDQRTESEALASQILEAAHRLVERRRLELYLRECGLSLAECEAERSAMTYRAGKLYKKNRLSNYDLLAADCHAINPGNILGAADCSKASFHWAQAPGAN